MIWTVFFDQIAIVTFLALLIWAAVGDYYRYLIPNGLSVAAALLFFVHVFAAPTPVDWVGSLIAGGAVFFVGAAMFAFRLLGGGDVKLLSAVALWAGPAQIIDVLLITGLAGGLLSLPMMTTFNLYRPRQAKMPVSGPRVSTDKQYIPYGIAIAAGGFYVGGRILMG